MSRLMGPVLSFRGTTTDGGATDATRWHLSALVVTDAEVSPLALDSTKGRQIVQAQKLWSVRGRTAYRYLFSALLSRDKPSSLRYEVMGESFDVELPAANRPPRMAYASCNGFSSAKEGKGVDDACAMWRVMAKRHAKAPYHLLLQGGDQVYADGMWDVLPTMRAWSELRNEDANGTSFTSRMAEELEDFYFTLYTRQWSQPEIAAMLARVPTVAMWDDHDIVDGWGSYPPERQNSPVFQGLWPIARRAFATFQQHLKADETHPAAVAPEHGFTMGHVVGGVALVALDMRSQRTEKQVLSLEHWNAVYDWLDTERVGLHHLLLMSSIPVVYPGFDSLERLLGAVPGRQGLEDDLRDHWNSRPHKGERLRLVHRLLRLAEAERLRVTLVSGDVHVAALGLIESARGTRDECSVINQLISSGVVHPSPPAIVLFALRHLFDSTDELDRGIVARMCEFPGTQSRFVGGRNFLSLEPDDHAGPGRIWANWFVEDDPDPFVKVIHPACDEIAG